MEKKIQEAATKIKEAKRITAFTGAGISVESGIPPFRGPTGLWSKYNPTILDIDYFLTNPKDTWASKTGTDRQLANHHYPKYRQPTSRGWE